VPLRDDATREEKIAYALGFLSAANEPEVDLRAAYDQGVKDRGGLEPVSKLLDQLPEVLRILINEIGARGDFGEDRRDEIAADFQQSKFLDKC
jgi:hypothetical protein